MEPNTYRPSTEPSSHLQTSSGLHHGPRLQATPLLSTCLELELRVSLSEHHQVQAWVQALVQALQRQVLG